MRISRQNNTSFSGIPVSNIRIKDVPYKYKLYDITRKDYTFLNLMRENIHLEKLAPEFKLKDYRIWKGLLDAAIESAKDSRRNVFIETCENIPCGILNYSKDFYGFYLNYIVTFPNKPNNRVPCAGQILMNELFSRFLKSDAKNIELSAILDSPHDPFGKYLKLGFVPRGGGDSYEFMQINRQRAGKTLEKQNEFISVKRYSNPRNQDLSRVLDLFY